MTDDDLKPKRKRPGRCPVCLGKLRKNARGTRYENRCGACRANLQKRLRCPSCHTHRVWRGPQGLACKGCGRNFESGEAPDLAIGEVVTAHEVWRRLVAAFPDLRQEVQHDLDLVHLTLGALESLANRAIRQADWAALERSYDFVLTLAKERDDLHPDVLNAIHVSFLEGLDFSSEPHGAEAKRRLPAILLDMWEAQMAYNRELGLT